MKEASEMKYGDQVEGERDKCLNSDYRKPTHVSYFHKETFLLNPVSCVL